MVGLSVWWVFLMFQIIMKDYKTILHEIYPHPFSPTFSVLAATGNSNNPTFIFSVEVHSFTTQAEAGTKKLAKENASKKMLNLLFGNCAVLCWKLLGHQQTE